MATIYTLRATTSDLSGGADFDADVEEGTVGAGSWSPAIAAGGTPEVSRGYTIAGNPGDQGGSGSRSFTVEVDVTVAANNTTLAIQLHRINSGGTIQSSGTKSAPQSVAAAVTLTYNFNDDLGTFAVGDRWRIDYEFINTHAHTIRTPTIATGTSNTEHTAPWDIVTDSEGLEDPRAYLPSIVRAQGRMDALTSGMTPPCTQGDEELTG